MNIVHIAPNAPYNEGWGYQENILPKYHARLGNDVTLIITNTMHKDGKIIEINNEDYFSSSGFRVIRRPIEKKFPGKFGGLLKCIQVYDLLEDIKPDYIFFHGLVSPTLSQVTKYKIRANKPVTIVADNHLDYQIGTLHQKNLNNLIFKYFYRYVYWRNDKYISRVFGVTPWRMTYAHEVFGVPENKLELLLMGADDEELKFDEREMLRKQIREKYMINNDEFLIVTGGKLDKNKSVLELMKAIKTISDVKLLIFGSVTEEIQDTFEEILNSSDNIIYVGWIQSNEVYEYFFASDLVFFPGQHSVLWEQACASKVPCVFKKWPGMEHVNNGGNSCFVEQASSDSIGKVIRSLCLTEKYYEMLKISNSSHTDIYLYSNIAKKSLEGIEL